MTATNDNTIADTANANKRAALLQNMDTATDLADSALVWGLKMTAMHGATSKDEVSAHFTRCASPAVYAADFNKGDKVQKVLGIAATIALIDKASKGKGSAYMRCKAALASVISSTKGQKKLNAAAIKVATKHAMTAADESHDKLVAARAARKAAKGDKPAAPGKPPAVANDAPALAKAAMQVGTTHKAYASVIKLVSQSARKLEAPEGRKEAHAAALAALATACEAWQVFAK